MSAPLYEALIKHRKLNRSSFHTPGHKNNPAAFPADLFQLDYTELPDTGSLFDDLSPISEAENLAAELFKTARTCLSAGGCTLCIQAMFRLAAPNGGTVLCSRVIHRSAVNTMALLGIEPIWAMPGDIVQVLKKNPDVQAVYVTSPNYYGQILDVSKISAACKQRGIPLLVDSAHGAQLMFTQPKLHPLLFGADMTADSAHKTLGVLTGGAWLNIADERFAGGAKQAMALFGSTSPSYPVMASLDLCREWLEKHQQSFFNLQKKVLEIKNLARSIGISAPPGLTDPTRVTLNTASIGMSGGDAAEFFRENGVEPEYADSAYVVFIATPFNTDGDFERLAQAIRCLPVKKPLPGKNFLFTLPPVNAGLREAVLADAETVLTENAVGRTAAAAACPCPPGIPVVMPGELVTKEAAAFLQDYGILQLKVLK